MDNVDDASKPSDARTATPPPRRLELDAMEEGEVHTEEEVPQQAHHEATPLKFAEAEEELEPESGSTSTGSRCCRRKQSAPRRRARTGVVQEGAVNLKPLRNHVERQLDIGLDVSSGCRYFAFLVLYLCVVVTQLDTGTVYLSTRAMQSAIRGAAIRDDDGSSMGFDGIGSEQDFYDWLRGAYFPAIQDTEWLHNDVDVSYKLHTTCDLHGQGPLACAQVNIVYSDCHNIITTGFLAEFYA